MPNKNNKPNSRLQPMEIFKTMRSQIQLTQSAGKEREVFKCKVQSVKCKVEGGFHPHPICRGGHWPSDDMTNNTRYFTSISMVADFFDFIAKGNKVLKCIGLLVGVAQKCGGMEGAHKEHTAFFNKLTVLLCDHKIF